MAPQPSIHLPLLNRASQAYEPGRVARVGPPPRSLENTPSSFRNQATTQGRTAVEGGRCSFANAKSLIQK